MYSTAPADWAITKSHEKIWTWLRKGNLNRKTESLQIASQSNDIRTNYFKAKIDKTRKQQVIISECGKLAQKEYKSRHVWVGKVIQ